MNTGLVDITPLTEIWMPPTTEGIRMHVSMPCPMKVPFKQLFTPFVETYNEQYPAQPISCPDITDCTSQDIGYLLQNSVSKSTFPDIIVSSNYDIFFKYGFYDRFLKTGVYTGFTNPSDLAAMPQAIRDNLKRNNMGALCFMSWSVVRDLSVENIPEIHSWAQLLTPDMKGQITVHGHADKVTFGLMYFLRKTLGDEAICQLARNITDIKHFSQIIKRFCSTDPHRTAFSILPDVAVHKIPSGKKVRIVDMKEGKVLNPLMMAVRTSKLKQCRPVLDIFGSKEFRAMLRNGCILPDSQDISKPCFMPDFGVMASDYVRMEKEFEALYLEKLDFSAINERATQGGVCR
ncbi:MAG: ABC transporter substrate-binding protein [Bacteroidales bacterium]|jgi:hypothetical protein|nr:ABC transporter substrate-binding protein [Bacteroidales bacterium]